MLMFLYEVEAYHREDLGDVLSKVENRGETNTVGTSFKSKKCQNCREKQGLLQMESNMGNRPETNSPADQ